MHPEETQPDLLNHRSVLVIAFLASAMGFIDGTVVAIALPQIRSSLGAGFAEVQWIVSAYILTLSAFILIGGGLADKLGVNRVFGSGVAFFCLMSLGCALSWDAKSLIIFRALQGLGAAIMVPGSMALIAHHIPAGKRGEAMGFWVAASSIATALGPFVGGFLLTYGGSDAWRWIFAINLPVGLLVMLILFLRLPRDDPKRMKTVASLDWFGGLLLVAAMGALTWGLTEVDQSSLSLAFLSGGVFFAITAIIWELRIADPMIDMRLFKSSGFSGANGVTLLVWTALGAVTFFTPMLVIVGWKLPPTYAGSMFLPFTVLIALVSLNAGKLLGRFGLRLLLTAGSIIFCLGCLYCAWAITKQDYWFGLLPGFAILGLGMGFLASPISTAVVGLVPEKKIGAASGINNMVARLSALVAVAGLGALVTYANTLMIRGSRLPEEVQELMIKSGFGERLTGALYQIPVVELQVIAMDHVMIALYLVLAIMAILAALVAWLTQADHA